MLQLFDLFCGTGGFSKGFENARTKRFTTILGIDILPMSVETFKRNHSDALALNGDIRKVRRTEIGERLKLKKGQLDVIIGGSTNAKDFHRSDLLDPAMMMIQETHYSKNTHRLSITSGPKPL